MAKLSEVQKTEKAEAAKGGKSFKSSTEVEGFYRFIHEHGLRREAQTVLKTVHAKIKQLNKKKKRGRKKLQ